MANKINFFVNITSGPKNSLLIDYGDFKNTLTDEAFQVIDSSVRFFVKQRLQLPKVKTTFNVNVKFAEKKMGRILEIELL